MDRCDICKSQDNCVNVQYRWYGCERFEIDLSKHDAEIRADAIDEYTDLLIKKCYAKFSSLEYVTEEEIREIVKKLKE